MQNFEDIRDIFQFEGTFRQKLVGLHTTPSVLAKFSVHAWRYCVGLNILYRFIEGQTHFACQEVLERV
jgi:hypothetical protein